MIWYDLRAIINHHCVPLPMFLGLSCFLIWYYLMLLDATQLYRDSYFHICIPIRHPFSISTFSGEREKIPTFLFLIRIFCDYFCPLFWFQLYSIANFAFLEECNKLKFIANETKKLKFTVHFLSCDGFIEGISYFPLFQVDVNLILGKLELGANFSKIHNWNTPQIGKESH